MTVRRPIPSALDRPLQVAVLISGGGTTLQNFLDQKAQGRLNIEIPLVIASRDACGGIARARDAGVRCEVVRRRDFEDVNEFSRAIFDLCRDAQADLVTLAGFLSLIRIPGDFQLRVMNIHPSLIPAFCGRGYYGHRVHEAALERGVKVSGCTVHFADNEYDHGPIIVQRCVPVVEGDTSDSLAARVFEAECEAYPEAIRLFASGRLEIVDGRLRILDEPPTQSGPIAES